jgi:hypothetical protein
VTDRERSAHGDRHGPGRRCRGGPVPARAHGRVDHDEITAVVNTGDDTELHGLSISPDLDTITYTLAEAIDPERGWGLAGETWRAMDALGGTCRSARRVGGRSDLVQPR